MATPTKISFDSFGKAFDWLSKNFPYPKVLSQHLYAYKTLEHMAKKHLQPGAKILDLGCGSCDKTAMLQLLGYDCTGYDDLQDLWYQENDNTQKIKNFTQACGINFVIATSENFPFPDNSFDMVMAQDIIEHLPSSPRLLLNKLLTLAKPGGLMLITVPNAVNIRKRIAVMMGQTNYPPYAHFYWHPEPWRGHVREYVEDDLVQLARYLSVERVELRAVDHMLFKIPKAMRGLYLAVTALFPGWKDSWVLVCRKPQNWVADLAPLSLDEIEKRAGMGLNFSD